MSNVLFKMICEQLKYGYINVLIYINIYVLTNKHLNKKIFLIKYIYIFGKK